MEDFGGRQALLTEGTDGESIMALREADTMFVGEELRVEVCGSREIEGALEEDLAGGGFEEITTADYLGDVGVGVVDYAR